MWKLVRHVEVSAWDVFKFVGCAGLVLLGGFWLCGWWMAMQAFAGQCWP